MNELSLPGEISNVEEYMNAADLSVCLHLGKREWEMWHLGSYGFRNYGGCL